MFSLTEWGAANPRRQAHVLAQPELFAELINETIFCAPVPGQHTTLSDHREIPSVGYTYYTAPYDWTGFGQCHARSRSVSR